MLEDPLPFRCTTIRLRAPPSVCDNAPTDLVLYNPELLSAFSTILSEREDSRREFLNNTKTIFFSLWLAGLLLPKQAHRQFGRLRAENR